MAYFLIKSEPSSWSWDQQVAAGECGTSWNGVRNYAARAILQSMNLGDQAFFYHSNEGKNIVGIVKVIKTYYPDPTDSTGKFGMVDFAATKALNRPVSLEDIKSDPRLAKMILLHNSRLSVQTVRQAEWEVICQMGGL